jgi:hypothetical protein
MHTRFLFNRINEDITAAIAREVARNPPHAHPRA